MTRRDEIDLVTAVARFVADEALAEAADPAADLLLAERRGLVLIAAAVDAEVSRRAGIEPRSSEEQTVDWAETKIQL